MRPVRATALVAVLGVAALGTVQAPMVAAQPAPDPVSSTIDPDLARVLDGLAPGEETTVVVTLQGRVDTRGVGGRKRERTAEVVRRLRAGTEAAQARGLGARLRTLQARGAVSRTRTLWVSHAVSVTGTAAAIRDIAARTDVAAVQPDAIPVTLSAVSSAPAEPNIVAVRAPELWARGLTGAGAVVATLDTGVDLSKPDLAARWRGGSNSWYDPYGQHPTQPVDLNGHGTATAGVIVGGDAASSYGVAPGAGLIAARVFDDRGATTVTAMHEAFQWLLDPDHDPATADAPDVVNASWALGTGPSCDLTFQPDVQALRAAGIVPVFAAGNFGPGASTSASPANYPESLSVGAVGADRAIWPATSAGPSGCGGRARVFPDLVAPGVSILTADRFDSMQYVSGTSIAAPHVAGALALLIGGHPGVAHSGSEQALTSTAVDLGTSGPDDRFGQGMVDVVAADAAVPAPPPPPPPPVAADFSLTAPASVTVWRGQTVRVPVAVGTVSGSPTAVTLTSSKAPARVGLSWTGNPVAVPGTATLVVAVGSRAAKGTYRVVVTGVSGGVSHSVTVSLVVRASSSRPPAARTLRRSMVS
ncbi:bacillopeptidase F [Phycicoccus duodecadis]|uniref:Bacillopeptidase F n=1 Tax=Phycicoccus duodecadis TaxID=173053 RepID=A0A2N3YH72_9MICO|nr:S8 family serine peptidase [Phycicoccus duodecadis]PKW26212.1 bacillopeptidase F [Phycicoccus duodecadis]